MTAATVAPPLDEPRPVVKGGVFVLAMLMIVGTLNFVDRQLVSVLIEPIRAELKFSDTQFGLLTGLAFSLFYAVMGIPAAMIADRWHRIRLIGAACLLWSLFTAACGFAHSFTAFALARFGVGVGESGGTAPSLSVLSDYFPPEKRPLVTGLFTTNGAIGVLIGAAMGGAIAEQFGWRGAFIAVGALGVVVAPLLILLVREPLRGATDAVPPVGDDRAMGLGEAARLFVQRRSLMMVMIASGLSAFVSYGMLNWIPAYLMRTQGMPLSAVASWYAPAAGIAYGIGTACGGWVTNIAVRRSPKGYALVPGLAFCILIPTFLLALWVDGWQLALALLFVPMAMCNVFTAPSLALTQNLCPPRARAVSAAIVLLMFNIVGLGGGPLFVGMVSDATKDGWGTASLPLGLSLLMIFAALAIVAQVGVARAVARDLGARA